MSLNDKVAAEITAAMKSKDAARLSALRMLKAAIMNKGVEKGRDLEDAEILQVVSSLVKQRRDSIEQFSKAGRSDLVEKETGEIAVLEAYLPPAASAAEIDEAVAAAIADPPPDPKPVDGLFVRDLALSPDGKLLTATLFRSNAARVAWMLRAM